MVQTEGKNNYHLELTRVFISNTLILYQRSKLFYPLTALPTLSSKLRLKQRRCWRRPRELMYREGPLWSTMWETRARKGAGLQVNTLDIM